MSSDVFDDEGFEYDFDLFGEMTKTERVMAAVNGDPVDRLPICFWHHFKPEGSGRKLADATFDFFYSSFDLDIVKVMPDIPYPFARNAIEDVEDWRLLEPIDTQRSRYITQRVEAVRVLRERLGPDTPIVVTVFSPLAELMYFAKEKSLALDHARQSPAIVHRALGVIANNLKEQNAA